MLTRVIARAATALALVFVAVGPASVAAGPRAALAQSSYPLTVVDDAGASVTFQAPPQRIVSLTPGHTETVYALGAGDRLVAVDTYSDYPAEARAVPVRLTTYPAPSIETIVGLQPDLVLTLVEKDDVLDQLRQQGIPVLKLFPRDFDATVSSIEKLGQVLDANAQAAAIAADMRARRDAVEQAIDGAQAPSVLYEMDASDPTKPFVAGPAGFYGQLVALAGGNNIFADLPGDFGQVGAESVIARNPDLIILADAYSPYNAQTPAMLAGRPGWDAVSAVRGNAIYAVNADLFSRPGPRLIDGLESLAYLFHPDRFAASDGPRLATSPGSYPFCSPNETPRYSHGFLDLASALGATMGDPVECPHADVRSGDTYQQTAKGLAVYRRATNTPSFSSGGEHWALTASGLQAWSGDGQ